jgi:t-SNARE complex subunit (syntaxin)
MARTPVGDADELESAAAACRQCGNEVEVMAGRLDAATSSSEWKSPMADQFYGDMQNRKHQLDDIARGLSSLAQQFSSLAAQVRSQEDFLSKVESEVKRFIHAAISAGKDVLPWEGTRWSPTNLPSSFDPSWTDVARDLNIKL